MADTPIAHKPALFLVAGLALALTSGVSLATDPGFGRVDGEHGADVDKPIESDTDRPSWVSPEGDPVVTPTKPATETPANPAASEPSPAKATPAKATKPTPPGPAESAKPDPAVATPAVEPEPEDPLLRLLRDDLAAGSAPQPEPDAASDTTPPAAATTGPSTLARRDLPLGARAAGEGEDDGAFADSTTEAIVRTGAALAMVIGVILIAAWILRRVAGSRPGLAAAIGAKSGSPAGLLEVLGRYPIGPRQSLLLVKFDRRVLLLSQSGSKASGARMDTVCELTEAEDVASVLMKVREHTGKSPAGLFREAMRSADVKAETYLPAGEPADHAHSTHLDQQDTWEPEPSPEPARAPAPAPTPAQRTVFGDDRDRDALWEDLAPQPSKAKRDDGDPVGLLRRKLASMRTGGTPTR